MAHIIPILELRNDEIDLLSFQIAYYKHLKPNGRPASRPLQAGFTFTFPAGRHDALFRHPLLRRERNPVSGLPGDFISGTVRFYEGSRDGHLLFKFSFEYGTIMEWQTTFDTHTGMVCQMHLMAGVVFYRNVLAVEAWVPNRERYPDKYLGFRNPGANISPPNIPVSFVVKKVEGPYDREGKLVREVKKDEQYTYHATLSKNPDEVTLGEVTWAVAYDDEDTSQARRLFSGGQVIDNRTIKADLAVEEGREKFRIYAYRGNTPDPEIRAEASILSFPMVIARSARRAGVCTGTKGDNLTREDIINLHIKYPEQTARLRQKLEKGFDEIGINYNKENPKEVANYHKEKASIVEDALEYISAYNAYSDEKLFDIMRNDADDWAMGALDDNLHDMIDLFQTNMSTSTRYEDARLTAAVSEHESTLRFISGFAPLLKAALEQNMQALSQLKVKDVKSQFIEKEYKKNKQNPNADPAILGIEGVQKLNRLKYSDYFKGLGIAVNDTQAFTIQLTDLRIRGNQYRGKFTLEVFDHFGLDSSDILKDEKYLRHHEEFISWYILQHLRGYKPFITYIPLKYRFWGTVNQGELIASKDDR